MGDKVYLDNSATTPVAEPVLESMLPFFRETYGNASSFHTAGREAHKAMDQSRDLIADRLNVSPQEIIFTSGATEGNNIALLGAAEANPDKKHLIVSAIEHHAVLHTAQTLEKSGYELTILEVDGEGRVDPDHVREALRDDTLVVSVMAGNNEIGTLQPVAEIGALCRERGVLFHSDAVQAFGKVPLPMDAIDLLSVSAHKLHGPKGTGFLYVRKGVKLVPRFYGGGHERGLRSGTENVPGIVGLAAATRLAFDERAETTARMRTFRAQLLDQVLEMPDVRLNGSVEQSLPHIANFSFAGIEGESLIMRLDEKSIAASTGSACSSPDLEASHVLLAIGVPISMAHGSLRISTGRQTTQSDIETFLDVLPGVVDGLREMSPFYQAR